MPDYRKIVVMKRRLHGWIESNKHAHYDPVKWGRPSASRDKVRKIESVVENGDEYDIMCAYRMAYDINLCELSPQITKRQSLNMMKKLKRQLKNFVKAITDLYFLEDGFHMRIKHSDELYEFTEYVYNVGTDELEEAMQDEIYTLISMFFENEKKAIADIVLDTIGFPICPYYESGSEIEGELSCLYRETTGRELITELYDAVVDALL